jgi:hypothetical protein
MGGGSRQRVFGKKRKKKRHDDDDDDDDDICQERRRFHISLFSYVSVGSVRDNLDRIPPDIVLYRETLRWGEIFWSSWDGSEQRTEREGEKGFARVWKAPPPGFPQGETVT